MPLLKKCSVSPILCLFFGIVLLMDSVFRTNGYIFFLTLYLSVFAHELGHALIGIFFGYEIKKLVVTSYGGYVEFPDGKWLENNRHKFHISAAGPLVNLLIAAISIQLDQYLIAELNLSLALFNLIPVLPMDGARILDGIIGKYTENKLIIPSVGILVGCVSTFMFVNVNMLASLVLMFFTISSVFNLVDLMKFKNKRQECFYIHKGKILFLEKQKHCIPVGTDKLIIHIVDQVNDKLLSENTPIDELIKEVADDYFVDSRYELEIRIIR